MTFYDILGVRPNANQDTLNKAHKKQARLLHPDKVKRSFVANAARDKRRATSSRPGVHVSKNPSNREIAAVVKEAHERAARLNNVATILRGPARERYDHFLKYGFPKWKGTGYYYSRFRPGLGSVLLGLFVVFGGGAHYAALVISWKRQREFVERYIRQARRAAWGDELGIREIRGIDETSAPHATAADAAESTAVPMNRRQKRMMERESRKESKKGNKNAGSGQDGSGAATPRGTVESVGHSGERKSVVADNGKVLVVDSIGNVYLKDETEDGQRLEFFLDVNEIQRPTVFDTALFRFPKWCYRRTLGSILNKSTSEVHNAEVDASAEEVADMVGTRIEEYSESGSHPDRATIKRRRRGQRT